MQISTREKKREDYALQAVPDACRTWGWISLMSVIFGASSAMMLFIVGAQWIEIYGAKNLILAALVPT
jgi:cytosine/uracil/thiamine/allantoin permease